MGCIATDVDYSTVVDGDVHAALGGADPAEGARRLDHAGADWLADRSIEPGS